MEGFGWIMTIILGGLAGWIAEKVMNTNQGLLMNIIVGIIGALFGNWLFRLLFDGTGSGILGQLIVAIIGACILIWGLRLIRSKT